MVIRNYKYSPEDVDCRYCTESEDGCCKLRSCPWLKERIEAGVVSYHEAVKQDAKAIHTENPREDVRYGT